MRVREFEPGEEFLLWELFYATIHKVNARDYSPAQVAAWAPKEFDADIWTKKIRSIQPFVAETEGGIVGYSDLQPDGLIDHFFVHHAWQRRGAGRALMSEIERRARKQGIDRLKSHVSATALGFFAAFGFEVEREQNIEIRGETLRNFIMRRHIPRT